jgi:hypothetical protein
MRLNKNVTKNFNLYFQILEDNKIGKKIKKLLDLVNEEEEHKFCLICCKQKNINIIKDTFKKRNIETLLINAGIILKNINIIFNF